MVEHQDQARRTEEPTPKRLEDARRKGDAPKSQEIIAAIMLAAGALGLWLFAGDAARGVIDAGVSFLDHPHQFAVDGGALADLFAAVALKLAGALAAIGLLIFAAAILANIGQARPVFSAERMRPSLDKISPIAGFRRIFGPSGIFNFAKGVGKIVIVGLILLYALWPDRDLLVSLLDTEGTGVMSVARALAIKLLGFTVAAMAVIAALDYAFQRHSWRKRLRMTKEEVRRELKETEGDPQIRGRLRQQRESRMRQRMTAAVKDATVLVMNPTHYAVALKYDMGDEGAPLCVAKGVDHVALRMRAVAEENDVPVVENPPLARALYTTVEIYAEIPLEHYEAVAKVIGHIMRKSEPPKTIH